MFSLIFSSWLGLLLIISALLKVLPENYLVNKHQLYVILNATFACGILN